MRDDVFENVKKGEAFTFKDERDDPAINEVYYIKHNKWFVTRVDGDSMTDNMIWFWGRGTEQVIVFDSVEELRSLRG